MAMKPMTLTNIVMSLSLLLVGCGTTHPQTTGPSATSSPSSSSPPPTSSHRGSTTPSSPSTSHSSQSTASWQFGPMDFITTNTGWVVARKVSSTGQWLSQAIFRTQNGGQSWTRLHEWNHTAPMPVPRNAQSGGIPPIASLNFQNANAGAAVIFLGAGACQAGYGILTTSNGGNHWTLQTQSILMGEDGPLGISYPSTSSAWLANGSCAGAYTTLFHSTDGGQQWSRALNLKTNNPSPASVSFHFTSPTTGYLVNGVNGYQKTDPSLMLYTTADGGGHWTADTLPSRGLPDIIAGLSFVTPHQGWAIAANLNHSFHVYHLLHTGTWSALRTPEPSSATPPTLDLVNSDVAYLSQQHGTGGTLWKTVDGGSHWSKLPFPTP